MLTDLLVYRPDGTAIVLGEVLRDPTLLIMLRHLA
jgi:hypothetical protein